MAKLCEVVDRSRTFVVQRAEEELFNIGVFPIPPFDGVKVILGKAPHGSPVHQRSTNVAVTIVDPFIGFQIQVEQMALTLRQESALIPFRYIVVVSESLLHWHCALTLP